jgi:hypothetical protein
MIDEYVAVHLVAFYTTYHLFMVHLSLCRRVTCYGTKIIRVTVIINKCIGNDMLHTEYANTDQILMLAEIFFKYWSISDWVIFGELNLGFFRRTCSNRLSSACVDALEAFVRCLSRTWIAGGEFNESVCSHLGEIWRPVWRIRFTNLATELLDWCRLVLTRS